MAAKKKTTKKPEASPVRTTKKVSKRVADKALAKARELFETLDDEGIMIVHFYLENRTEFEEMVGKTWQQRYPHLRHPELFQVAREAVKYDTWDTETRKTKYRRQKVKA